MSEYITLRLAKPSDAVPIALLSRDLIEIGLEWCWIPARVANHIRCPDTVVLVACTHKRLIGFAIMDFGEEDAHLNLLAVRPEHQRTGIGRRLIKWLEKSAVVAGILVVSLEVRVHNHGARRFYQALGYREVAQIPRYYSGREPAIRMVHELHCTISGHIP